MAQNEKKGGFFARFRKGDLSANAAASAAVLASAPAPVPAQPRVIAASESKSVSAAPVRPAVPVADSPSSEPKIDTVAAFSQLCSSLAEIGASQLKIVELTTTMLATSINKIAEGLKPKK